MSRIHLTYDLLTSSDVVADSACGRTVHVDLVTTDRLSAVKIEKHSDDYCRICFGYYRRGPNDPPRP